jgi:hypothetical protein
MPCSLFGLLVSAGCVMGAVRIEFIWMLWWELIDEAIRGLKEQVSRPRTATLPNLDLLTSVVLVLYLLIVLYLILTSVAAKTEDLDSSSPSIKFASLIQTRWLNCFNRCCVVADLQLDWDTLPGWRSSPAQVLRTSPHSFRVDLTITFILDSWFKKIELGVPITGV